MIAGSSSAGFLAGSIGRCWCSIGRCHADRDRVVQQQAGERGAGELAALVGIEDLRSAVPGQRLLDRVGMAAVRGATMSLSSGCGGRSNMRRSICTPTTVSVRHVLRSGGIWTSITANGRIRVLLPEHRIVPTSTTCRCSRQPKFRHRCRGVTPAGLRPPCVTPRQRHTTISTGRGSTYRGRNTVSTKPATSGREYPTNVCGEDYGKAGVIYVTARSSPPSPTSSRACARPRA